MTSAAADLMVVRQGPPVIRRPRFRARCPKKRSGRPLLYEYRKEFIGEGQLIFFFKRTNRPITFSEGNFNHGGKLTLPIPDSESAI